MDQGIRIVWYDLPDEDKHEYLQWLHNDYLPSVLSRPGIMWAAHYRIIKTDATVQKLSKFVGRPDDAGEVPVGSDYALLIGAGSPHVFFKPKFDELDDSNPMTCKMFAQRLGVRTVVATEQAQVNGPEISWRAPGTTPGPFIQLGHFRVRSVEEEFDLSAWYADYRLPTIATMKGAIAARKLVTVAGWAKHVVLYEFISSEAHHTNFMAHEILAFSDGEWTNRVVKYTAHAPGSPSIAERLWPLV
jgi:hypothetical protein